MQSFCLKIINTTRVGNDRVMDRETILMIISWTLPFGDSLMRYYRKLIPSNAGLIRIYMHGKRRLFGRLHSNLTIWSSVKSARAFPQCSRATCASYKNGESRRWESSFARVTTGFRVKGPPANQLPKQRPKLIFPSSSTTVSVVWAPARVWEKWKTTNGGGSCPLMYDGVWWKIDYHIDTRKWQVHTSRGINRAKGRRISCRLSEICLSLNIDARDFLIHMLQILKFII